MDHVGYSDVFFFLSFSSCFKYSTIFQFRCFNFFSRVALVAWPFRFQYDCWLLSRWFFFFFFCRISSRVSLSMRAKHGLFPKTNVHTIFLRRVLFLLAFVPVHSMTIFHFIFISFFFLPLHLSGSLCLFVVCYHLSLFPLRGFRKKKTNEKNMYRTKEKAAKKKEKRMSNVRICNNIMRAGRGRRVVWHMKKSNRMIYKVQEVASRILTFCSSRSPSFKCIFLRIISLGFFVHTRICV